jgi:hypothetical protein
MEFPKTTVELTTLFQKLGAKNPESWAQSQINEGIPQIQRYLFLRQAWKQIIHEDGESWINKEIQQADRDPYEPYSGIGLALKRLLAIGAQHQDLIDIARGTQAAMLFQFCLLLDYPDFTEPELESFAWGLFEIDENDNPVLPRIGGLHESVLDLDPTGLEMRPKIKNDA